MKLAYDIEIDDSSLQNIFIPNGLSTSLIQVTIDDILKNINTSDYFMTLDYGCGCGYIGLALAKNMRNICKVTLYDNDKTAIESSKSNMYYNNLNEIDIVDDLSKTTTKFNNIIFYQPWLTTKEWKEKEARGLILEPKNAYVVGRNMYKNFIDFCSEHVSKDYYLILLQYVDDNTYNKLSQMFKEAIPECVVESRKYDIYKFMTITNEKSLR